MRELLNYGHPVGHALEVATDYTYYKHGEAVVLGMLAAGKIAVDKGMWSEAEFARQKIHRSLMMVGSGGSVILSLLFLFGFIQQKKNNKLLSEKVYFIDMSTPTSVSGPKHKISVL